MIHYTEMNWVVKWCFCEKFVPISSSLKICRFNFCSYVLKTVSTKLRTVKVSKSQKEISDSPHTPKHQQFFLHSSALASKSGQIKKPKALIMLNSPNQCIKCLNFFLSDHFLEARAEFKKKTLFFLEYGKNLKFPLLTFRQ